MTEQAQDFNVHVRYDGRSYEFAASQLDLGDLSTDEEVRGAVTTELNLDANALTNYEIDRHANGNLTLHPMATFGLVDIQTVAQVAAITRTKKQIQADLLTAYENGSDYIRVEVWSDNPWTAAKVTAIRPLVQEPCVTYGFSKLCRYAPHAPNDVWDAEYGKTLATQKAIAKIAKRFGSDTQ